MTASSPKAGRVLYPASYQQSDDPLDSVLYRNVVANNALHAADQTSRVFVNWRAVKSSLVTGNPKTHLEPDQLGAANTWYPIGIFGPWPMSLWDDLVPYKVRVELVGASTGGATATFGMAIAPVEGPFNPTRMLDSGTDNVDRLIFATTTSATPAILAASTGSDLITPSPLAIRTSEMPRQTLDDTGGALIEVITHDIAFHVYAKSSGTGAGSLPKLYGLHIAEFVG